MAGYEKQTWTDKISDVTAERMNHIEKGIEDAGKTGGVETGSVIGWTGAEIPEGYEEVDSSLMPSGVEEGAVIGYTGQGVPEGYDVKKMGYSTEEILTGETWKDGKPVYSKVITGKLPAPDINGTNWVNVITNASNLVSVSGIVGARPYNNDIVLRNGSYVLALDVAISSNTIMYRNLGITKDTSFEITIKYTKTTDTGNFKYIEKKSVTPIDPITGSIVDGTNIDDKTTNTYSANIIDGLVKETYSTEETVVGTYLGKPLYKRTYTNFTLSTGTNIEYYIFETDTNKVMKKAEGVLWLNENDTTNYYTSVVGSGGVDFGASEFSSNYQNGNMYVSRAVNNKFITKGLEVTVYYTKTTD